MRSLGGFVLKCCPLTPIALAEIRRIPVMPFPDPVAHSHRAFGDAVFRAYSDIQRIAAAFVATHKSEGK